MKRLEVAFLLGVSSACAGDPAPTAAPAAAPVTPPAPPSGLARASDRLDALDPRTPLPLLPAMALHQKQSMREHLEVVQEIVAALSSADFEAAERAAARIGLSEQMGHMCTHMGAAAPGFTDRAIEFHQTADRIAAAARARDAAGLLAAFSATLQTCTSCHAAWKQQVVDEPTWQRLTALAPSSLPR